MDRIEERYRRYQELLTRVGQAHLLRFWPRLSDDQRAELLSDLDQVDFERCVPLVESLVRARPTLSLPARLDPPDVLPADPDPPREALYREARERGRRLIAEGRVAAFTVAGGQGTRLGFDGPKGAYPITPVRRASLFQVFAEYLIGTERRYGRRPPWYVMTSPDNHEATLRFFDEQAYFGLARADVKFFRQGQMPAFDRAGRMLLSRPHRLALSPDGHGGCLDALRRSGALADMARRGVELISYFQVDNPLVAAVDPLFIGLHVATGSEASSKAVTKVDDLERVGQFVLADGRLTVVEYSDLPEALARARNPDGSRRFDAGSIAIHVFDRAFVERLTSDGSGVRLPWHRAEKRVATVDDEGRPVSPAEPNAVKLERFVFDAIPLARRAMVMYTRRAEEFSPVKNAAGVDSVESAQRDLVRRAARWLEACGCAVPRDARGEPDLPIEISPAFALDAEDLRERLGSPPRIRRGEPLLLA